MRKGEAEVVNLMEQIPVLISEARVSAVEEFKASAEMRDLNVKFGQEVFIKRFELCQEKVVKKFLELDLNFLDEVSEDEVGPFPTVATTVAPLPRTPSSPTPISKVETSDFVFFFYYIFFFLLSLKNTQSIKLGFSLWRASPLFFFSFCNETHLDAFVSRWQCPVEVLPLPQGVPLNPRSNI